MSSGRPRSENAFSSDTPADPSLEKPLGAIKALAGTRFDVLGPLGRDSGGEFAFLARELSRDRLVVLKQRPQGQLQVISQLDSSVPPPAGSCPVCQAPFANWEPSCRECGADVAGSDAPLAGALAGKALEAVREAAQGYEVLGTMIRAVGGAPVYFAREQSGGHLVALRLEQESGTGRPDRYTITATRMTRPKVLYGTIGRERSGDPPSPGGSWTPIPSPPVALPAAGTGLSGQKVCPQCNQIFGSEIRFCPLDGAALRPSATSDDLIGRIIADRYRIVGKLGQGGMGTVYLAEHVRMGRRCAIKVMNSMLLNDPDSLDRFSREAKNASLLNHPHIAAVYDFGETSDGIVYLAMEFVEGESLAAVLHRTHALAESQALDLGSQVADALSAAHEMGIVHRDLKPDNVMVCPSKSGKLRVKVVDFGIAKATHGSSQTVTRTGYVVGTPAYMSPEQILGDPLDGRSDLYSLGCILYEMLTGERAFSGPSGEVSIRRRLTEPPPRPRSVKQTLSKSLDDVVTRAMARSPEQRFQSAGELRDVLLATLHERPKRNRWLPWRGASSSEAPEEVLVGRAPEVYSAKPLLSPPPFVAPSHPEDPPLEAVSEWPDATNLGTRLRHRSARSQGTHRSSWLFGGLAGATLLGAAGLLFVSAGDLSGSWTKVTDVWRSLGVSPPAAPRPAPRHELIPLSEETTGIQPRSADPVQPPKAPTPPATATIRLGKLLPAGARVTVDSMEIQVTEEGLVAVEPGRRVIRVRAPGYRSARRTVTATAGDTTGLDLVLLPLPVPDAEAREIDTAMGAIVVKGTLPTGAVIRIDGRVAPPNSQVLTVGPGEHSVALSVPGYATHTTSVTVEQGSWSEWTVPDTDLLSQLPSEHDPKPTAQIPSPLPGAAEPADSAAASPE